MIRKVRVRIYIAVEEEGEQAFISTFRLSDFKWWLLNNV